MHLTGSLPQGAGFSSRASNKSPQESIAGFFQRELREEETHEQTRGPFSSGLQSRRYDADPLIELTREFVQQRQTPFWRRTMCQNASGQDKSQVTADPGAETITLTVDQLENLLEELLPSGSNIIAGLAQKSDYSAGTLWEKCMPCIAGFKSCLKCSWTGCKVRIRRC
jgi:hypothetical protein